MLAETPQTKADWIKARQPSIGSSEAATILGCNPYQSKYSLWAVKSGLLEKPNLDDNEAVYFGNVLEPIIADEYAKRTGRKLVDHGRFAVRHHSELGWMVATLDREIVADGDRLPGALEVKSTSAYLSRQWNDEPPLVAQVQLQHQLAVTGWTWGSVAGLIGGQRFLYRDQTRDEGFINLLIEKEFEFLECIRRGTPPEVDASDSTAETLKDLYKRDTGVTVVLPGIAVQWDAELVQVKAELKALESKKQELENKFKAELKDASIGILDNGISYSLKTQERAGFVVPTSSFRVLRRKVAK